MSGKYGDLIKKAREPENQITNNPNNQITSKPDFQMAKTELEKPEAPITNQLKDQIARLPDSQITRTESEQARAEQKEVNLCVKVPKSLRQHWAAEAKRQGTTMTAIIIEALTAKFGEPN